MIRRSLIAVLLGLLVVLLPATPALADDSAPITRYDVEVTLNDDGSADVALDFTMDFGRVRGRGPIQQFSTKQIDGTDADYWYEFEYSRPRVTSDTGARTDLSIDTSDTAVVWRIGNEHRWNDTPQDYRIEFTMRGFVVSDHAESGLDEFNWNVFSNMASDTTDVTVTVDGPVPVERAACFTGSATTTPCDSTVTGGAAVATLPHLPTGGNLQVVAGFPAGTFGGVEQIRTKRPTLASNLTPGVGGGAVAGGLGIAALAGSAVLLRRQRRDLVYLGLTPGTVPPRGEQAPVGLQDMSKVPVAVQFQPPKGATPGEIGTLVDATADGVDVSATLVDLAVRGYLQIVPGQGKKDFTLVRTRGADLNPLEAFERDLLNGVFRGATHRTMEELKDEKFHDVMSGTRTRLYDAMVRRQWFVKNPRTTGVGLMVLAILSLIVGVALGAILWNFSLALVGVPFIILGLGLFIASTRASRRTPQGSAMLAQARGFELYLRTAEADQIRFEEGIDVFSRYLPYAMIFGVADRWGRIFEQLEAQGRYRAQTDDWFVGHHSMTPYYFATMSGDFTNSFGSAMSASAASYAAAQASSGSSGGSGFSGGGGFGGGSTGSW